MFDVNINVDDNDNVNVNDNDNDNVNDSDNVNGFHPQLSADVYDKAKAKAVFPRN